MIRKITLKEVASYNQVGVTLDNLKKINFIYGNNGSGKTTLSECIRNAQSFPSCTIEWQFAREMTTCVYNRNFVSENFLQGNSIKGIFTLGKDSVEAQSKIRELKETIVKHDEEISNLLEIKRSKTQEKTDLDDQFKLRCWDILKKVDKNLNELIKGYRNSKEKFMLKFIEESKTNKRELRTLEEIRARKKSLYDRNEEVIIKPSIVSFDTSLEENGIFTRKIIGKEDVDIAGLITKLEISDWVNQGVLITKDTDGLCPFCQQPLPDLFEEKLNNYFDHTYERDIKGLDEISDRYILHVSNVVSRIELILADEKNTFIKREKIRSLLMHIQSTFEGNNLLIEQKKKEPSRSIKLASISEFVNSVNDEIVVSNKEIDEFNKLIENSHVEKESLVKDMWRFIVEENSGSLKGYNTKKAEITNCLVGLEKSIAKKRHYKGQHEADLVHYQQQITSVQHSVNEINEILSSFGFTNFKLASASGEGNYKIIRETGEDANETLSEGEKTLITFLYFYQLLKGSNDINEIVTNKVVVIDDPISSLDSTVLFMVSSLVRELMFNCNENKSDIKQLFILTHNIYFHKEVSFRHNEGSFWILRKINNVTSIELHSKNPIQSSYELLWKELKNSHNQNLVSIQNIMRRIIENYFKFFGGMDIDIIEDHFDIEQKMIVRSLMSWLNDGSHSISEDMYVESNTDVIERYKQVFESIFVKTNHHAHYAMMMGEQVKSKVQQKQVNEALEGSQEIMSGVREAASGTQFPVVL